MIGGESVKRVILRLEGPSDFVGLGHFADSALTWLF